MEKKLTDVRCFNSSLDSYIEGNQSQSLGLRPFTDNTPEIKELEGFLISNGIDEDIIGGIDERIAQLLYLVHTKTANSILDKIENIPLEKALTKSTTKAILELLPDIKEAITRGNKRMQANSRWGKSQRRYKQAVRLALCLRRNGELIEVPPEGGRKNSKWIGLPANETSPWQMAKHLQFKYEHPKMGKCFSEDYTSYESLKKKITEAIKEPPSPC